MLVTIFLLGWGFNYGRLPVEQGIGFNTYQPTLDELRTRVYDGATELSNLRHKVTSDTAALTAVDLPADLEGAVRPLLAEALLKHDYPAPGRPRGRQLKPKGVLLRLSTAGVYWPWAGEGNIDAGLHPLQKPAVMAHERNDLQAIYDNSELYKDIAPVVRDAAYDTYLKAQGIHEGLLNYGKVVRLVEGYRRHEILNRGL